MSHSDKLLAGQQGVVMLSVFTKVPVTAANKHPMWAISALRVTFWQTKGLAWCQTMQKITIKLAIYWIFEYVDLLVMSSLVLTCYCFNSVSLTVYRFPNLKQTGLACFGSLQTLFFENLYSPYNGSINFIIINLLAQKHDRVTCTTKQQKKDVKKLSKQSNYDNKISVTEWQSNPEDWLAINFSINLSFLFIRRSLGNSKLK